MRTTLLIAMAMVLAAPLSAQTFETGAPVVLDVNDNIVGSIIEYQLVNQTVPIESYRTAVFVDGDPVVLTFDFNFQPGFLLAADNNVPSGPYFESTDCTGQAYLAGDVTNPGASQLSRPGAPINSPALFLWVADNEVPTPFTIRSILQSDGACSQLGPFSVTGLTATEVATPFSAPFRVGVAPAPIAPVVSVPAVGPLGLSVLTLSLLIGATWMIRRAS